MTKINPTRCNSTRRRTSGAIRSRSNWARVGGTSPASRRNDFSAQFLDSKKAKSPRHARAPIPLDRLMGMESATRVLWEKARAGDRAAYDQLFALHTDRALLFVRARLGPA